MKKICYLLGALMLFATQVSSPVLADSSTPKLSEDLSGYRHIHSLVINDKESPLFGFHHFYKWLLTKLSYFYRCVSQACVEQSQRHLRFPEPTVKTITKFIQVFLQIV